MTRRRFGLLVLLPFLAALSQPLIQEIPDAQQWYGHIPVGALVIPPWAATSLPFMPYEVLAVWQVMPYGAPQRLYLVR